ncbi:hypothetical protein PtA15_18A118 [Puccinia triticina]|uniref:RXLR phytopathogen effector protein WY-domain domain-containing protein n=1 Tax=Puccinia triticina TaxID=208348 RepID=A0ABY7D9S9_9BASI|nr:uncharacterized protein PtA15_18A118 [Puccinia triticina]WAQ93062.1 hypothetical protein PtA15_18A118 [Puccinia triticina]
MFSHFQAVHALVQLWCVALLTGMVVSPSPKIKNINHQRFKIISEVKHEPLISNQDSLSEAIRDHAFKQGGVNMDDHLPLEKANIFGIENAPQEVERESVILKNGELPNNRYPQLGSPSKKKIKPVNLWNTKGKDMHQMIGTLEDIFGFPKWKEAEVDIPDELKAKLRDRLDPTNVRQYIKQAVSDDLTVKKKWLGKDLNPNLLYLMLKSMNIREPVKKIGVIAPSISFEVWSELRKLWRASKSQWASAEIQISTLFTDQFEARRRILAFRRLLHRVTITLRWSQFKYQLMNLGKIQLSELEDLEDAYGLSIRTKYNADNVDKIPKKHWHWDTAVDFRGSLTVGDMLKKVCGEHEAKRRQELNDYKMKRKGPSLYWLQHALVKHSAQQFGVDVLSVCKIVDSLQLCDNGFRRVTFDESFSQLLEVFIEQSRYFPRLESPEHVWLVWVYQSDYKDRLFKVARSIELSDEKTPLSTAAARHALRDKEILEGCTSYGSGLEVMLWCGVGFDLEKWFRIRQIRDSHDQEKINDLMVGLSGISNTERTALQWWHKALDAHLAEPTILPRFHLKILDWLYQFTIPWVVIKQRAQRIFKDTFDQLKPWACTDRHRHSVGFGQGLHRPARKRRIVTRIGYTGI